jgi:hypothetical protein
VYPKELKTDIQTNAGTYMFIATALTGHDGLRVWKQPKCPSVDKWIKMQHMQKRNIVQSSKRVRY